MNEKWTDFEKFVFKELNSISRRISKLEGKGMVWGAIAGAIMASIGEVIAKGIWPK